MSLSHDATLAILSHNLGFPAAELWVDYAIQHNFRRVKGTPVPNCPDCGRASQKHLGQYIYYSTLIHLKECDCCHLIWADAHLDLQLIKAHFETAYKDQEYFIKARLSIFKHLVALIDRTAPKGGRVLDVGGAQGHLMHLVASRRPDLRIVISDLSEAATRYTAEHFHLQTICGDLATLGAQNIRYDVVVLSDVLYYEPQLAMFWSTLPTLVANGGTVIIRVPNKLLLIRAGQAIIGTVTSRARRNLQDRVRYFNPEHIYILNRRYLTARLKRLGFIEVRALPSPLLSSGYRLGKLGRSAFFHIAAVVNDLFGHKAVVTPSMVLVAKYANVERNVLSGAE